jgi:hypothetical protein
VIDLNLGLPGRQRAKSIDYLAKMRNRHASSEKKNLNEREGYDSPLKMAGRELARTLNVKKTGFSIRPVSVSRKKTSFSNEADLGVMMDQFHEYDQLAWAKEREKKNQKDMPWGDSPSPMLRGNMKTQND